MTNRFGAFTLDTRTRQLFCDGQPVHLAPKAFEFLTVLVNSNSKALTKAELHERLWPNTFVSDGNLARVVADLRAALGETGIENGFIRTVHGYGYAFNGNSRADGEIARRPFSRCWLVRASGDIRLQTGETVIGRHPDSTVWLDLTGVSRRHARIVLSSDAAVLEDLGSKNGTFLDDVLLTRPITLSDGNRIRVASVTLEFRTRAAERLTATE